MNFSIRNHTFGSIVLKYYYWFIIFNTKMRVPLHLMIMISSFIFPIHHSCMIQGTDSGICTFQYLPQNNNIMLSINYAKERWSCPHEEAEHCMPFCVSFPMRAFTMLEYWWKRFLILRYAMFIFILGLGALHCELLPAMRT